MTFTELDLSGPLPTGRVVIEASAGTGKTYSLSALVVRHIAERGVAASALLVVTYTRAAAAELRDRTRRALVAAVTALDSGHVPADQSWLAQLLGHDASTRSEYTHRLHQAIASFDDATITTIHGFCQQALRQLGLRSGTGLHSQLADSTGSLVDEVCRDLVVASLVDHPGSLSWTASRPEAPAKVLAELTHTVTTLLGNPGAVAVPDPANATAATTDTADRLARWVSLVHEAVAEVDRRRRARQELGFDDLVTGLRDAIVDPVDGPAVVAALRSRYQLVMVDEFQDTDPVQWQILREAFTGDLVTVGDPKQAIYRFRGADVHAYLAATAHLPAVRLGTNFRSDAQLVAATNTLLAGVQLGDPRIVVVPVEASSTSPRQALTPGMPLVLRRVPSHASLRNSRGLASPLVQRVVLADLVRTVIDLLQRHTITNGEQVEQVNPGHIAVLVPGHGVADKVMRALARADIPAVRTRTGSVFLTPAALEWRLLLAALERPASAPVVRAAGLGVFIHRSASELDPLGDGADDRLAELQQRCAQWGAQLAKRPFLAWYDELRAECNLVASLLGGGGGERELTDLDHIAELLASELGGVGTTAAAARRCLDRFAGEASDVDDLGPQMRRIDSDADAVQITTIHSSKGLQYPIVLVPFSYTARPSSTPLVYNDPSGQRVVDIASGQGWTGGTLETTVNGRKHFADVEQQGDAMRLLYVALTRAEHRSVVWWAPLPDGGRSALSRVLLERDDDGAPSNVQPELTRGPKGAVKSVIPMARPDDDADAAQRLAAFARRSGGLIEVDTCPLDLATGSWHPPATRVVPPVLSVADPADRVVSDPSWRRWSFTSITRTIEHHWDSPSVPVMGGVDEPSDPDGDVPSGSLGLVAAGRTAPSVTSVATSVAMPWANVAGGTAFGTLVHSVLERLDPAGLTLSAQLHDAVFSQLRRDRLDVAAHVLEAGIHAALHTPLGPLAGGLRLVDIAATDRLAELDFDLPLVNAGGRFPAAAIGQVLLATLPAADPQLAYARSLAEGRYELDLGGYLQGSIDAVLRVQVDGQQRFVVVDYKTNRLHRRGDAVPLDAYHPDRLPEAMAEHDYPLQSLLYSVALHRYLRWRLADYQPQQHLGGIAYLFLRGMVGQHTPSVDGIPYGVFSWHPPAATIVALDRLLASGVAT
jgi:exodeoxyribonuclease V beta subunit